MKYTKLATLYGKTSYIIYRDKLQHLVGFRFTKIIWHIPPTSYEYTYIMQYKNAMRCLMLYEYL